MSLDSWLARCNGPLPGPRNGPPRKRARRHTPEGHVLRLQLPAFVDPPRKLSREDVFHLGMDNLPPEYVLGRRDLGKWETIFGGELAPGSVENCLQYLPNSTRAIVGHYEGQIEIIDCIPTSSEEEGSRSGQESDTSVLRVLREDWPITGIAPTSENTLLCSTKRGVADVDLNREVASISTDLDHAARPSLMGVTALAASPADRNLVAFGTDNAAVGMLDLRIGPRNATRIWNNAHAIVSGPTCQRVRSKVNDVCWVSAGPTPMLASGSNLNDTVKFWDLRASRSVSLVNTSAAMNSSGSIRALTSPDNQHGTVWGYTSSHHLVKISAYCSSPEYRLAVKNLAGNPSPSLEAIPGGASRSAAGEGSRPQVPLLACGSKEGVSLVTQPSDYASDLEVDACQAALIRTSRVSSLKWHPYINRLLAICYDDLVQFAIGPGSTECAGRSKIVRSAVRMQKIRLA